MNQNQQLITLYLEETLDDIKNNYAEIIHFMSANLSNHIPYSIEELAIDTGLLERYEIGIMRTSVMVPDANIIAPLPVNGLVEDTQGITKDLNNIKYLLERLGKDETNLIWLSPLNDWVETVSDFQSNTNNNGDIFDEFINIISSIFARKVIATLAIKYGFMAFDKDVIEVIEKFNKLHPNMINITKIKPLTHEEWKAENKEGLALMLPTLTSSTPEQVPSIPAQNLFLYGEYQATDASIITEALYALLYSKTIKFSEGDYKTALYECARGTVYITMNIPDQTRDRLIAKGEMVFKVIRTLISYYLNSKPSEGYHIDVSGADILAYLDQLYPRDGIGNRKSKEKGLNELAEAIMLITNMRITTTSIEPSVPNKLSWSLSNSALFDISYKLIGQQNLLNPDDIAPISDIELSYGSGKWSNYLHTKDKKYHNSIGYVHRQGLSSKDYAGKLWNWLTHKLELHPQGDLAVWRMLDETGHKELSASLLKKHTYDPKKAARLYDTVTKALDNIASAPNGYIISYRNRPQWMIGTPPRRRPTDWFKQWAFMTIVFSKPDCMKKIMEKEKEKEDKPKLMLDKASKDSAIDVQVVLDVDKNPTIDLDTLEARIKEAGVSKRSISHYLNKSQNWLSREMTQGELTRKDFNNIYNAISVLSKKKN